MGSELGVGRFWRLAYIGAGEFLTFKLHDHNYIELHEAHVPRSNIINIHFDRIKQSDWSIAMQ